MPLDINKVYEQNNMGVTISFNGSSVTVPQFIMDIGRKMLLMSLVGLDIPKIKIISVGFGGFGRPGSAWESGDIPNNPTGADDRLETKYLSSEANMASNSGVLKTFQANFVIPPDAGHPVTEASLEFEDGTILSKAIIDPSKLSIMDSSSQELTISWAISFE